MNTTNTTTGSSVSVETSVTGVRKEVIKGSITLDKISKTEFQKPGTLTAQIRQVVTTKSTYPSKKTSSSMQANIFDNDEFGFEGQEFFNEETRVAFIPVPEGISVEEVTKRLTTHVANGATIYRVLSSAPILDENQNYAINQGLSTIAKFANSQVVRYPDGHEKAGQIWTDDKGRVQYRKTYFWKTSKEDVDLRGKVEPYVSPEIIAELEGASALQGQTI